MEHQQIQFQLERWTGREYVPHGAPHVTTNPHTASNAAETARMLGLPSWRMVRVEKRRPTKVPKRRKNPVLSPGSCSAPIDAQCRAYLDWAKSAGLDTVTVYEGSKWAAIVAGARTFNVRYVNPADFLGPVYPDADMQAAA